MELLHWFYHRGEMRNVDIPSRLHSTLETKEFASIMQKDEKRHFRPGRKHPCETDSAEYPGKYKPEMRASYTTVADRDCCSFLPLKGNFRPLKQLNGAQQAEPRGYF